jgi:DNA polymerase III delta prime subunit
MTYLIIHTNSKILEQETAKLLSKYLGRGVKDIQEVCNCPDFHILKPEEKESITIDQCKRLQKDIIYKPFQEEHQFGIILNAQLMTTEAQNSLLKTLEEKNENTILILTVNNEKSVLETILSRCTRIYPKAESFELTEKKFSEEENFLKRPIYEKIQHIEQIVKEDKVDKFLENLILFFKTEYTNKIRSGLQHQKEIEILQILKDVKFKIGKNVNKKIALEYLCFKLD